MAPQIKDSVEAASLASEAAVPQAAAPPKQTPAAGHLRADALSLEVPVKVHGSRVIEVARGGAPHTEPFEEETSTMIVFPQGAVLRMSTPVSASQMLVVTNLKTRQDAICRVVKVRTFSNMQGYVEVEFTHKQPGYWGANFPTEGSAPASPAAPAIPAPATAVIAESPVQASAARDISPLAADLPAAAPAIPSPAADFNLTSAKPIVPAPPLPVTVPQVLFVPPSKSASTFAVIGTQEEVQPAASPTSPAPMKFVAPVRPVAPPPGPLQTEREVEPFVPEAPKASIAEQALAAANIEISAEPDAPPSTPSLSELRGDEQAALGALSADLQLAAPSENDEASALPASPAGSTFGSFGSFSGGTALGVNRAPSAADTSETSLDGSLEAVAGEASQPRGNSWLLIAACVGILFAGVFGGVFYFRTHPATPANSSIPKADSPSVAQTPALQSPSEVSGQPAPNSATTHNSAAHPVSIVTQSNAPAVTVSAGSSAGGSGPRVVTPERQNSKITADLVEQQSGQHPVTPQRSDAAQTDAAPAVDAAPSADSSNAGALSGIISPNVAAPAAPEIRPSTDGPIKVGGNVQEPRLIYRVMPEYPLVARESGVQGDVVIKTTVDVKGSVVNVQVVSGPLMLRGPALAALRRWKYAPSTLNGQPIAVQMLVTIKFSR